MKKLCTICARGGSQGVKNKNVRLVAGKPLIAHTLLQAKESKLFDAIAVSSDSDEILAIAEEYQVDCLIERPSQMATSTAAKLPVIQHAFHEAEKQLNQTFAISVDLDATSPLRNVEDIINAVNMLSTKEVTNVITGAPARRSPYFNLVELDQNGIAHLSKQGGSKVVRRQDSPRVYDMNASIYVWWRDVLLNENNLFLPGTNLYEMPEERSIDIDSPLDFDIVSFLLEKKHETN